jgi:hypothetical protein
MKNTNNLCGPAYRRKGLASKNSVTSFSGNGLAKK